MPAPGDQYQNIPNPFEERPHRISAYTAQEIATLQSRLNKQLGPEYISTRPGAGGGKVAYLAAEKVINLANEVFGFNGWSSSIQNVTVDFADEIEHSGRINLGISIVMRVTLKDGTFHEDIGYGQIENARGKAAAFEKAKKEAATDALKRALRTFGNILGNCLYDKDYLSKVGKMKVTPAKWDTTKLHRHADYALPEAKKPPPAPVVKEEPKPSRVSDVQPGTSFGADFEDEYGSNFFDGVDLNSDPHVDDVTMMESDSTTISSGSKPGETAVTAAAGSRQPMQRVQSLPSLKDPKPVQQTPSKPPQPPYQQRQQPQPQPQPQPTNRPSIPPAQQGPNAQSGIRQAPSNNTAQAGRAQPPANNNQRPPGATEAGISHQGSTPENQAPPGPVRFVTGRAAEMIQKATGDPSAHVNAPSFNPHAESPSLRRTSGINHNRSGPIKRDAVTGSGADTSSGQSVPAGASSIVGAGAARANFVNPQSDANRKIGMPGQHLSSQSPLANRSAYKPPGPAPGMKRGPDGQGRPPLADMSNMVNSGVGPGDPQDAKRPRVNGGMQQ